MGKKFTTYDFIKRAKEVHGEKYDYSLVQYKDSHSEVKIKCSEHGYFYQIPNNHLCGKGCIKCGGKEKLNNEIFIKKSKEIHGDKYDYSLVEYNGNKKSIKIICPDHGIFEQRSSHHFHGIGCPKCVGKNKTLEEFILQCRKIHGDKYDYSLVDYKSAHVKIKIICTIHNNIFEQTPHNHLHNNGCPICCESYGEKKIRLFLSDKKIKFTTQKTFNNCKHKLKLPFDVYLPNYNVCIEYDGKQHFERNDFFGGEEVLNETRIRDEIKNEYCKYNNIHLIRIKYDEKVEEILSLFLKSLLDQ